MSLPYLNLNIGLYQQDTRHLSTEEHGAYLLILMAMTSAGGKLVDDDDRLARIAGLSAAKWRRIGPVMREFLMPAGDGFVTQKKVKESVQKFSELSQARAQAGAKGGQATALKLKGVDPAKAEASAPANHPAKEGVRNKEEGIKENLTDSPFDAAHARCLEAAGNIEGWGVKGDLVFGPVYNLIAQGCDLELDILPTVRDVCESCRKRQTKIAGWRYFVEAIRRARDERLEGTRTAPAVKKGKPPPKPVSEYGDEDWQKVLRLARTMGHWYNDSYGPPPFAAGCMVPAELLDENLDRGYSLEKPKLAVG